MARIPEGFIEDVRRHIDIVDVVSEHVQLRRTGRSFVGLCPFHSERSPSFSVSTDRQLYHCFGCGAGGTVIRFLMDIEGIDFTTAVVSLAERAGMEIPFDVESPEDNESKNTLQRLKDAHDLAAKYYGYILMNTSAGVQALAYLENRGILRQTMVDHQLGYAPAAGDTIVTFLRRRGFSVQELVDSGLAVHLGTRVVDRFRSRVMVPIANAQGQVIAFGGRTLEPDGKPKYLNSPETPIFQKSQVLYNQYLARKDIRQTGTVILFEGYMDVLSAWQAGVQNVVATLGTSFTPEQATIMKRFANRLVLAYDGDSAGEKAIVRGIEIASAAGLDIRVTQFPEGLDPDDYIRKYGAAAFEERVTGQTLTIVEFLLNRLRARADTRNVAGRTEFLRQALEVVAEWATPIEQETAFKGLSQDFQVSVEALKEEFSLIAKRSKRRLEKQDIRSSSAASHPGTKPKQLPKGFETASRRLLQASLHDASALQYLFDHDVDELATPEQTALLALYYGFHIRYPEKDVATFVDSLADANLVQLASALLMEEPPSTNTAVLADYLRTIQLHHAEVALREAMQAQLEAKLAGNETAVDDYRNQVVALLEKIQNLKTP
jgi:DNA primase